MLETIACSWFNVVCRPEHNPSNDTNFAKQDMNGFAVPNSGDGLPKFADGVPSLWDGIHGQ